MYHSYHLHPPTWSGLIHHSEMRCGSQPQHVPAPCPDRGSWPHYMVHHDLPNSPITTSTAVSSGCPEGRTQPGGAGRTRAGTTITRRPDETHRSGPARSQLHRVRGGGGVLWVLRTRGLRRGHLLPMPADPVPGVAGQLHVHGGRAAVLATCSGPRRHRSVVSARPRCSPQRPAPVEPGLRLVPEPHDWPIEQSARAAFAPGTSRCSSARSGVC